MKLSPQDKKLYERLNPSKFTAGGFLGHDERPLEEIIAQDRSILISHNIDLSKLGEKLTAVYDKTKNGFGNDVVLSENLTGTFFESMGRIPSPFTGEGVFEKGEARIHDNRTGEVFILTALSIHLIKVHAFFQGKGSRYRLEPVSIWNAINNLIE